ncbi:MAG: DUF4886 domain-containing protein [Eubacteriales bacterium]|nr:DUF4886 domain-containing protein [Eubacteriales bacterium]
MKKVLAIGNSFSQDSNKWLQKLVDSAGEEITFYNLHIGGCSLDRHWSNIAEDDIPDYALEMDGEKQGRIGLRAALAMHKYDYITIQQRSGFSGLKETYYPFADNLVKYLTQVQPQAEIIVHQTWAYQVGSTHGDFPIYSCDQEKMFLALKDAYNELAVKMGQYTPSKKPLRIIPNGEIFQRCRAEKIFADDNICLNRDGFHASLIHGRYMLGASWFMAFTGKDISKANFLPEGMTNEEADVINKNVREVMKEYGWETK